MLELSYNNGSTFRSCQKKFYWRYVEHLEPVIKLPSLTLGAVLHDGFDQFYKGMADTDVYHFIGQKFNEEISKQEVSDQEDLLVAKYIALGMWLNYPYKKLKEYDSIESEERFEVPLCEGVKLVGKVDGRIAQYGNWWVRELKTSGLSQRQFEGRCQTSAQGTGYVYGLTKMGYDIKGIMYEYIKKPILRKGVNETADEFGRRIMHDYKTRPKLYYNRYLSYRTPTDLSNFEEDTIRLAEDIIIKLANGKFYRNLDACWTFGAVCPYEKICFTDKPDTLTVQLYFNKKEVRNGGHTITGAGEGTDGRVGSVEGVDEGSNGIS